MRKIAIVMLLTIFVATPALADNIGKYYVAGDLGSATYSNVSAFPNPKVFRISAGYHYRQKLAAEVGYSVFGDSTAAGVGGSATLSATSFQIAAVSSRPLSTDLDLIIRLGLAYNSGKATNSLGKSVNNSYYAMVWGLGAQYHVSSQVSVRAQYDDYGQFENVVASPMKATAVSLGVVYNF